MDRLHDMNPDLLSICMSYLEIEEQYKILQINQSIDCIFPTVYTFPYKSPEFSHLPTYDYRRHFYYCNPPKQSKQYVEHLILNGDPLPVDDYRLFPNLRHIHMISRLYPIPPNLRELTLTIWTIPIIDLRTTNLLKLTIHCNESITSVELPTSLKVIELANNSSVGRAYVRNLKSIVFHEGLVDITIGNFDLCYTLPLSLKRFTIESSTITQIKIPTGCVLEYLNCLWCPELVSLGNLPPSLTELDCAYSYRLKNIDLTGTKLKSLNCSGCPINELTLPPTLTKLYCYECLSLVVCKLPYGLKELWFDGNHTTAIDLTRLPDGLTDLTLYGSDLHLTCPKGLKRLWCSRRTLTTLDHQSTLGEIEIGLLDSGSDMEE